MNIRTEEIHPHLNLAHSSALRAPSYARIEGCWGILGNGFFETRINFDRTSKERCRFTNKYAEETYSLNFSLFEAWFEDHKYTGADAEVGAPEARGSADISSLTVRLTFEYFDVDLSFVVSRGEHFFQKLAVIHNVRQEGVLHRVSLFRHQVQEGYSAVLHDGGMYYPIVFFRGAHSGMFFCIDFPGYFASVEGNTFRFDFYPGVHLVPGHSFQPQTAHIGITALTGRKRSNPFHETGADLDEGERQWFREYLTRGATVTHFPHVEILGRKPGRRGPSELETLDQCRWLNAQHVALPQMMENIEACPLARVLKQRMVQEGIRASLTLTRERNDNLSWVAVDGEGRPMDPGMGACFACEDFCRFLVGRYVDLMDEHHIKNVEVSGAPIVTCYGKGHGHAEGRESLQMAFQGLVEVVGALRENGAHLTCSGPYGSYGAGVARMFDSISLMAPAHPLPLPDIHVGRLFADMNRLYFRRSFNYLLPKHKLVNTVGLDAESCPDAPYPGAEMYPWHLYHDRAGWRYAVISAIATGLRHQFHVMPQDLSKADRDFAARWLAWEGEHAAELQYVEEILDEPGLGPVDGYSCAGPHGAIVFLFNTTYDPQEAHLGLRLDYDADYVVRELYPREYNYLGPNDGLYRRNSTLRLTLAPKEARVIEAVRRSPASAKRKRPEIFGAPGEETGKGVRVRGVPGTRQNLGIRTAEGYREMEARFPGTAPIHHIDEWTCTERTFDEGLEMLAQGGFKGKPCGEIEGRVRNMWVTAEFTPPTEWREHLDVSPFELVRPCWTYEDRLFFVARFEPPGGFDPIRTASEVPGIPENYQRALPHKCGFDLTPMNLGLRAWINGTARPIYPALAAWNGYTPNRHPIVAYYFEAGSQLRFGDLNHVTLFTVQFDPGAFKGIYIEHVPAISATADIPLG